MVRIAIAGGSGNVAREIIDVLVPAKKHDILILSRNDAPDGDPMSSVTWVKVNYEDPKQLAQNLQGVHTVLSFVALHTNPQSMVQKNLIDAAVQAGVKRFAPSEWATSSLDCMSFNAFKAETRHYLEEVNKYKKVLEYTLFQPGLFLNYLSHPYKSSNHIRQIELHFDFNNRKALLLDGGDADRITLTTVQDLANIVARAVDFEGEWPVVGGIRGTDLPVEQLVALGEKIRGAPFHVEKLKAHDLKSGAWKASWVPKVDHPSIPPEQVDMFSRINLASILLAQSAGAFSVSDEWNRLIPDYEFTQAEDFLTEIWRYKPEAENLISVE